MFLPFIAFIALLAWCLRLKGGVFPRQVGESRPDRVSSALLSVISGFVVMVLGAPWEAGRVRLLLAVCVRV